MKRYLLFLAVLLCCAAVWMCYSMNNKQTYTIIVSLDGFRWDYTEKYHAPNISQMAEEGAWTAMRPSYPASTFPNHYAMATGLVPDHNGIVNNSFWDPESQKIFSTGNKETASDGRFFLGEPIWLTAQRQGLHTSVVYWVGSDVAIQGKYPDSYKSYREPPLVEYFARVDTAMTHLKKKKEERPRLVMIYFDEPDHMGHLHGPDSPEVSQAVEHVDSVIGYLRAEIKKLDIANKVNLIVLADHGMTSISDDRNVKPSDYIKPEWYEHIITGTPTSIFSKPEYRDSIYNALKQAPHIKYWKKEDIPAELQYGSSPRVGDIVVAPDMGWQFSEEPRHQKGAHGYDNHDTEMLALFRAVGPSFKKGFHATEFQNVDIYPLLTYLLGIEPAPNDGQFDRIKQVLK